MAMGQEEVDGIVRETVHFMLDLVELAAPRSIRQSYPIVQLDDDDDDDQEKENSSNSSNNGNKTKHPEADQKKEDKVIENQPLVAEPHVTTMIDTLKRKSCLICDSPRLEFLALRNHKYEHLCSESCVEKYKKFRQAQSCLSCRSEIGPGPPAYRPNFGVIGSAVCSQTCLLKYDERCGPKAKCRNGRCAQPITNKSPFTFHWQSMDFCSATCVNELLRAVGAKCTQCRAPVPFPAIGKYSVRFGDVVRQFCNTNCLSAHKKSHRSCSFCQTEIRSSSSSNSGAKPVDRDFGEGVKSFCNNTCLDDFMRMDSDKKMNRETETTIEMKGGNFCDICLCYYPVENPPTSPDHMLFRSPQDEVIFLCGTICASAYRYKNKINSLFCNYCYKLDWNLTAGVLLRFSEKSKIFCTRRCMNLFIIRVRKLINCDCCKCCKYQFDLIEEFDSSGQTTYFCSLICLNLSRESKSLKQKYGNRLDFIKCFTCLKIRKAAFHVKDKYDPDNVHSFCTYTCYSHYLKNPPKPPPPKPKALPPPTPPSSSSSSFVSHASTNGLSSHSTQTGPVSSALRSLVTSVSSHSTLPNILRRPAVAGTESAVISSSSASEIRSGFVNVSSIGNQRQKAVNGTGASDSTTTTSTHSQHSIASILPTKKQTLIVDSGTPLGQLVLYIREQGLENTDLTGLLKRGQKWPSRGQPPEVAPLAGAGAAAATSSNTREILVVKEKPKQMANAAVQVRRGTVTKAVQCKPYLVDTSVSTEDE